MRGKGRAAVAIVIMDGDHPRICGEKVASVVSVWALTGSPPHMRGKAATAHRMTF